MTHLFNGPRNGLLIAMAWLDIFIMGAEWWERGNLWGNVFEGARNTEVAGTPCMETEMNEF